MDFATNVLFVNVWGCNIVKKNNRKQRREELRLNQKTKKEQIFILVMLSIFVFSFMCISGCGGQTKSCEIAKCNKETEDGLNAIGVSIPGCGGCLTSGRGCNSCLWAQSYKISVAYNEEGQESETEELDADYKMVGCNTMYYADSCGGCAQEEKHVYIGFMSANVEGEQMTGAFYTSPDGDESLIGYYDGCGGCINSEGVGAELLNELEGFEQIN